MEKIKIVKKRATEFQSSSTGQMIKYWFYKAVREKDGVTLEFGSKSGSYEVGDNLELTLEKSETVGGRFRYKEVSS